nr:response regulator [Azoarcus sp. L1K30]
MFVQLLIDAMPNPVFFKGPDGRFLGCNSAYEQAFGTTRAYLAGKTVLELPYLPAPDRTAFHDEDMRLIASGDTLHRETRLPLADGKLHDTLYWARGFCLGNGAPGGLLGVIVDISAQKDAERQARKAEARLLSILSASPIAVVLNRPDGRMLFANQRTSELAGIGHDAFLARSALEWFERPSDAERLFARLRQGEVVHDEEVAFLNGDGSTLWTLLSMSLTEIGGEPAVISWIYDITARRAAEREVRRLSRAVEHSPAMLLITSPSGEILYANPRFCLTAGQTAEQLVGTRPRLLDDDGRTLDFIKPLWQALKAGSGWQRECRLQKTDGGDLWIAASVSALTDERGEISDCIWILDDIGARRDTEAALRRARDLAEDAAQAKSRFLANMSHEIRTPMNAIIGLSHLALAGNPPPRERDYLEKIHRAGNGLLGVINDILDFSKIEAGKLKLDRSPFLLGEVLDMLVDLVGQKGREKGLELILSVQPDVPPRLIGDPLRLGQVLINLVSNAIKFTEHGEVSLRVGRLPTSDGKVLLEFAVRDTGIGMNDAEMQHLFKAFTQADASMTRRFGGTGLGLSICQQLVGLMGGNIEVSSSPNAGSTFTFKALFDEADSGEEQAGRLPDVLKGLRVLVVDDNPSAREVLQDLLAQQPFRVDTATGGQSAVEMVHRANASDPFGLVLMDMNMPGVDGLEATTRIKSDRSLVAPPVVIMVTAFGDGDAPARAADAGADGFLHKPVTASHLVDALQAVFDSGTKAPREEALDWRPRLSGLEVLVVEDSEINQQIARELLENAGMRVHVAGNGRQALEMLRATPTRFDAVLMDIQMPEMDGFEATRLIRADARFDPLPVISMTAHAMAEERQRCLDAGMNEHVAKPIDPNQLFSVLARLTTDRRAGTGSGADTLPTLPGLNTTAALRRTGNRPERYMSLLRRFVEHHHASSGEIANALAQGNNDDAERIAHSIRGVAANIGASALEAAAENLERQLRHHTPHDRALARFDAEFASLLRMLVNAIPAQADATATGVMATDADMAGLRSLLLDSDGDTLAFFTRIAPNLVARCGQALVDRLSAAVSRYDFDDAVVILDQCLEQSPPLAGHAGSNA